MSQLQHSLFHDVLFPKDSEMDGSSDKALFLKKVLRYLPGLDLLIQSTPLVIFDFETTGLDSYRDKIIEIGGLRIENGKSVAEFSTLIDPEIPLPETAAAITGISQDMLDGQPTIEEKLPEFLEFFKGSILVAHNAEFDMAFLRNNCERQGIQLEWPSFCTLKLARNLLPDLESKSLDALAEYYNLTFESRHRSIGDCKVTSSVLQSFLTNEGKGLQRWGDFNPFIVAKK